ncbi:hypothetical protein [Enterococcus faecalis]|nr:hypothetical protein [Enterococcus faecalis]
MYERESEIQQLSKDNKVLAEKLVAEKKEYDKQKKKVQAELNQQMNVKGKPLFSKIMTLNHDYQKKEKLANDFFQNYYTWNNSQEYHNRKDKLKELTEKNILDDKNWFDEGKDDLGGDYIKISGIQSELIRTTTYVTSTGQPFVEVEFSSWFDKNKANSSEKKKYYLLNVDETNNKINQLESIF